MIKLRRTHKGDTIVEVLICIAIVGMVIATAYAIASRSLKEGIYAAERIEALKLAEAQIENLKFRQQHTPATSWSTFTQVASANNFCLDPTANGPTDSNWGPVLNTGSDPEQLVTKASGGGNGYDLVCNPLTSSNGKYFINITIPTDPFSPYINNPTYLIKVRWESFEGGNNQTQIYYRF